MCDNLSKHEKGCKLYCFKLLGRQLILRIGDVLGRRATPFPAYVAYALHSSVDVRATDTAGLFTQSPRWLCESAFTTFVV